VQKSHFTERKFATMFFLLWAQDEHRTLFLSSQRVAQKCKVSKIWTISCDNSKTVRDIILLITIEKSHTGFRLVPTSITLNDLDAVIALILRFSPNLIALEADYVTVVADRPIMSVKYCLPVPVFDFRPKLMHPAARSLCNSWASC